MIDTRVRIIKQGKIVRGPVVYWMSRDQRIADNWALLYAQRIALQQKSPLVVAFCLVPHFLEATIRQYGFMLRGLQELEAGLHEKNISFVLTAGSPEEQIPRLVKKLKVACLITDFDPLRIKRKWKAEVGKKIDIPFHEVDAHNIIPCWIASPKQEYAAYTIRPKISRLLPKYLDSFPSLKRHPSELKEKQALTKWEDVYSSLRINHKVGEVTWLKPGEKAAKKALKHFAEKKLRLYDSQRNDPTIDGQSNLSPYLHFGHISGQRVTLEVQSRKAPNKDREAFLEELIVRRELSDNFCYYNDHYDSFEGFPSWAKESLNKYRKKPREYIYTLKQFEHAETHDRLWNAAQLEMTSRGKMHGYMRMYWAKKILEWSESPERAMEIAIFLNDRYELDGRDPNGYVGIAWSIGGVHDRAWNERRVFGKVRYMSYNGCKGKFDVIKYIEENGGND
ncbi:MAG: deoxyribodipyrimidine photo-lyase [Nitrospiraceae bacterium]|nr:MAG: deoxyribodipyrimidine photo-lyase [Nitrospiraceae bacterium]